MTKRIIATLIVVFLVVCTLAGGSVDGLVYLRVVVSEKGGRTVTTGLRIGDFQLTEKGKRRPIEYVSDQLGPVSAAIILDLSASMLMRGLPKPESSVEMVEQLTRRCAETLILAFAGDVVVVKDFADADAAPPRGDWSDMLRDAAHRRSSSVYDALLAAARMLTERAKYGRRLILLISDGQDRWSRHDLRDIVEPVQASGARLCLIAPQGSFVDTMRELERLVDGTGGSSVFLPALDETGLSRGISRFLTEQAHEYVLGFRPLEPRGVQREDLAVRVLLRGRKVRFTISPLETELGRRTN